MNFMRTKLLRYDMNGLQILFASAFSLLLLATYGNKRLLPMFETIFRG